MIAQTLLFCVPFRNHCCQSHLFLMIIHTVRVRFGGKVQFARRAPNLATAASWSSSVLQQLLSSAMPLKKKTRTSTTGNGKTKTKRNFVFKDNAVVGPTARTKPLVSALKENNRCLATALGKHIHCS